MYVYIFFFCFFGYENFRNFIFWPKLSPTCTESVVRGNLFEKQGFIYYRPVGVHPKNPIILANLGEPIPTPATFKGQVQRACPMWPQVKGALVK